MPVSFSPHAVPVLFAAKNKAQSKSPAETEGQDEAALVQAQLQHESDYWMAQSSSATLPKKTGVSLRPDDSFATLLTERQLQKAHTTHTPSKTYTGIDALLDLGVDLMPDHQFDDLRNKYKNPDTAERKRTQAISDARVTAIQELNDHKRNPFDISEISQQYLKSVCLMNEDGDIPRPIVADLGRLLDVKQSEITLHAPKSSKKAETRKRKLLTE